MPHDLTTAGPPDREPSTALLARLASVSAAATTRRTAAEVADLMLAAASQALGLTDELVLMDDPASDRPVSVGADPVDAEGVPA